ncbi:hypothetical protein SAMN05216566_11429 [Aureimonas phyllosphaerae]|nr:hypothetical protein SAMN05216566_11429 [Aureimonas phyllosphaerae]
MGAQSDPAAEVSRLALILAPATEDDAVAAVAYMFRILPMGMSADGMTDDQLREAEDVFIESYRLALRGFPKWAVLETRDAFIGGRVAEHSGPFSPNSAVFGRECARRVDADRARLGRAQRQLDERRSFRSDEPGPLSEEARERGRRRVEELRASAEAKRRLLGQGSRAAQEKVYVDTTPITPEALDAAGVPDAPARDGSMRPLAATFQPLKRSA